MNPRLFALLAIGFIGCSSLEVEKAFEGKFTPIQNNKTINNYCQSCHIHKDFDPGNHVAEVRKKYRRKIYRNAKECRVCHFVETRWNRTEMKRKTRYPNEVDRGLFRKFEQRELKKTSKK